MKKPVKILIESAGDSVTHLVRVTRREESFTIPVRARPTAVLLDPGHDILRWEPEYGPEPGRP